MAEQELDRSEQATPHKLEKARERGQTPRSMDAVGCAVFAAAMLYLAWQGPQVLLALLHVVQSALVQAGADPGAQALWPTGAGLAARVGVLLLPFLLLLPLVAVVATLAQTGPVLSLQPLRPDLSRLDPVQGFKRLLSLRTLFDGARACVKLAVLVTAAALAVQAWVPRFAGVSALPAAGFALTVIHDIARLGLQMAVGLALVAVADILFTRREYARKLRMSRRELRDEFRNREGDPRIRARLRELRRELLRRSQALKNSRTAPVVLANPTHYAVALRYVHGEMDAPRIVAKGAGQLAAAMREIAARHRVVVVTNPPLARRLFRETHIDEVLPASFHAEVARIMVWVLSLHEARAKAGGKAL